MRMRILSSSSKPISSPGRTDKFPPPLMRFLKSNVSSRSTRGRSSSRTNSLFFGKMKSSSRRNRTPGSGLEPTQEPSSPKVTCIGQVRVRRSKKSNKSISNVQRKPSNKCTTGCYNPCCCFRKPGFLKRVRPGWPKWRWVFWSGCCRSVKVRTAASSKNGGSSRYEEPIQPERVGEVLQLRQSCEEDDNVNVRGRRSSAAALSLSLDEDVDDIDSDVFIKGRRSSAAAATTTTPPKNALLLTRCRSAPYRSSSLACRFWCEEEDTEDNDEEEENINMRVVLGEVRKSSNSRDSTASASESRGDRCSNFSDNEESKSIGVCAAAAEEQIHAEEHAVKNDDNDEEGKSKSKSKSDDGEEEGKNDDEEEGKNGKEEGKNDKDGGGTTRVGLMLIRCKSEPARRGMEKCDPQGSEFWRLRRLGNTLNSSPHVAD